MLCHRDCGPLQQMPQCSRHSCCTTGMETQASMSAGRSSIRGRLMLRVRLGHRFDDTGEFVEYLADLAFTHDQWRAERQRVANGAEHDIVFEET